MKKYISPVTEQTALHTESHLMLNISNGEGGTELTKRQDYGWNADEWANANEWANADELEDF